MNLKKFKKKLFQKKRMSLFDQQIQNEIDFQDQKNLFLLKG